MKLFHRLFYRGLTSRWMKDTSEQSREALSIIPAAARVPQEIKKSGAKNSIGDFWDFRRINAIPARFINHLR